MSQKPLLALRGKRVYDPPIGSPVPDGGTRMRSLTAAEALEIGNYLYDDKGKPLPERRQYMNPKRLCFSICDDEGNAIYGEEDIEALSELPEPVMEQLMTKFWEMQRAEYVTQFLKN